MNVMKLQTINNVKIGKYIRNTNDFPKESFKFASFKFVYNKTTDLVRSILDAAPLQNKHKYVVVDVKVHQLEKDEYPALRHWHCDCVSNPLNEAKEELHHLWVSGPPLTEFLNEDVYLNQPASAYISLDNFIGQREGKNIPAEHICTYGRAIHRAVPAIENCTRLLVRVTESDIVPPQNIKFNVTRKKYVN